MGSLLDRRETVEIEHSQREVASEVERLERRFVTFEPAICLGVDETLSLIHT